jgi:hypothetical protein
MKNSLFTVSHVRTKARDIKKKRCLADVSSIKAQRSFNLTSLPAQAQPGSE